MNILSYLNITLLRVFFKYLLCKIKLSFLDTMHSLNILKLHNPDSLVPL